MSDQLHEIREFALKRLAKREYSEQMLREKIRGKFPEESDLINQVLEEFKTKDWLSDQRYADFFWKDATNLKKWGPIKIGVHLKQKGISDEVINKISAENFGEIDLENARHLAAQKSKTIKSKDTYDHKQKLTRFLLQRGFSYDIIYKILDE